MTTSPTPSLFRRSLTWFLLAALGNLAVILFVSIASLSPVSIPASDSWEFLGRFAGPMYAPELLIFTSLVSVLSGLRIAGDDSEGKEAARLIAWAVRVALAFILSFAVVIIAVAPESLATVLFAVLLGFVTFVLAERLAPPAEISTEERFHDAEKDFRMRSSWASEALGQRWRDDARGPAWPSAVVLFVAPTIVQAVLSSVLVSWIWDSSIAFTGEWIFLSIVTSYGSALLTLAWLSTADKAESTQVRAWLGITGAAMGVATSIAFAGAFIFTNDRSAPIGWLILAVTAVHALALWGPLRLYPHRMLRRIQISLTDGHLHRVARRHSATREAWEAERAAAASARRGFWGGLFSGSR
jgi:hypothetical protein